MTTEKMTFLKKVQQHQKRIRRNIEAARLRRIRRHTKPGYTHCMNCGTKLKGMYCHQCGQYALDIYQPIWKYIRQYFENMYQFDGKIWMTLRLMFTRPGFLTNEFNSGKINSYVHPFRLYMCISVVFFTLFFMAAERSTERGLFMLAGQQIPDSIINRLKQPDAVNLPDTTIYAYNMKTLQDVLQARGVESADKLVRLHYEESKNELNQATLPRLLFDACLTRTTIYENDQEQTDLLRKYKNPIPDPDELVYLSIPTDSATSRITADVYDWMTRINQIDQLHQKSTATFILGQLSKWTPFFLMFLLPIQALIFKLFYRKYRYMEHFAHATHLSCILLILLAISASTILWEFNVEQDYNLDSNLAEDIALYLCPLALLGYQFISMHTVYHQTWKKTTLKCLLTFGLFNLLALGIATALIIWLVFKAMGRI